MNPHVGVITLGVGDLNRAKQFYRDGLGWPVQVDQGHFVSFRPADGSSSLALYPREVPAGDAGVSPDGGGFRGITFSYIVRSEDRVDAVLAEAERAGGEIAEPAQRARWVATSATSPTPTAISGRSWPATATSRSPSRTTHHPDPKPSGGKQRPADGPATRTSSRAALPMTKAYPIRRLSPRGAVRPTGDLVVDGDRQGAHHDHSTGRSGR